MREAGKAFGKRGYHNTSLDDVAVALGVSKGTLYNYVKDKQEILWEFHRQACEIGNRAFAEGRKINGTGADVLRAVLIHYVGHLAKELGVFGALVEIDALRPEDRAEAIQSRDDFERQFVALINAGIKDGSIRDVDQRIAVFTFMGAINWIGRWYSPAGRMSAEQVAKNVVEMIMFGLSDVPIDKRANLDITLSDTGPSPFASPSPASAPKAAAKAAPTTARKSAPRRTNPK